MRRRLLVVALVGVLTGCGGGGPGATTFFDSSGSVTMQGWDMQVARFSPDGNHLAVIAVDDAGNWVLGFASNGTVTKSPLVLTGMIAKDVAWMPDSDRLLVAVNELGGTSTTKILCVKVSGVLCPSVAVPGAWHHATNGGMSVSSDGSRLAIQGYPGSRDNDDGKPSYVYVINLAHPALTPLPGGDAALSKSSPTWIDSSTLAVIAGTPGAVGQPLGHGALVAYSLSGTSATTRTLSASDVVVTSLGGGSGQLVYRAEGASKSDSAGFYSYTANDGKTAFLGDYSGDTPAMAPDGSYFVYVGRSSPTAAAVISTAST